MLSLGTVVMLICNILYFLYARLKNGTYYGNAPGGRAGGLAGGVQFCPEHISYMYGGILMKLHRNVHHYEEQCRAHEPGL
jgi:hypothetical protein